MVLEQQPILIFVMAASVPTIRFFFPVSSVQFPILSLCSLLSFHTMTIQNLFRTIPPCISCFLLVECVALSIS
jgi:hypothetical protein